MCILAYNIVFAMINESTMVNSKKSNTELLFTLQRMIQLHVSSWFGSRMVRLTYIDINRDIV